MKPTPRLTLAAGAVLVLLANAVALGGAYFNRSGEPDARVVLSQRELWVPWDWRGGQENSGLALGLNWRVGETADGIEYYGGYSANGGTPAWLDEGRLAALGFDTRGWSLDDATRRRLERALPRDVLLVLELGGTAWERALQRARENAARHEAARAVNPDSKEFAARAKGARDQLEREETSGSRLFAVDAGLDHDALRAKYPDRGRFLILKATVRPQLLTVDKQRRIGGHIGALRVARINVPFALRAAFEPALARGSRRSTAPGAAFEATLVVGRRLEPWLESLRVGR